MLHNIYFSFSSITQVICFSFKENISMKRSFYGFDTKDIGFTIQSYWLSVLFVLCASLLSSCILIWFFPFLWSNTGIRPQSWRCTRGRAQHAEGSRAPQTRQLGSWAASQRGSCRSWAGLKLEDQPWSKGTTSCEYS